MSAPKNQMKTRGRPFQAGNPGGPGRPEGSRNKATVVLDALANDEASEILSGVILAAKSGDMAAAKVILDRCWPARKGGRVTVAFPPIARAQDIVGALGTVAEAVGRGELSPEEGSAVASILETQRKAVETVDIERRIAALEEKGVTR